MASSSSANQNPSQDRADALSNTIVSIQDFDSSIMYSSPMLSSIVGPGRAVRAPPGTPYLIAGTAYRPTIEYDPVSGHAVLHVGDESSSGGVGASPDTALSSKHATSFTTSTSRGDEHQRFSEEQLHQFQHFMRAYPLLEVLPPRLLVELRYRREEGPSPLLKHSAASREEPTTPSDSPLGSRSLATYTKKGVVIGGSGAAQTELASMLRLLPTGVGVANVDIHVGKSCDEPGSLRALTWGGCRPHFLRAVAWRLLSSLAPLNVRHQEEEMRRKRELYATSVRQYCSFLPIGGNSVVGEQGEHGEGPLPSSASPQLSSSGAAALRKTSAVRASTTSQPPILRDPFLSSSDRAIMNQLQLDLPRHASALFHCPTTSTAMSRALFLWSKRHPAVGYVQGLDDFFAVFYLVFLTDAVRQQELEVHHHIQPSISTNGEGEPAMVDDHDVPHQRTTSESSGWRSELEPTSSHHQGYFGLLFDAHTVTEENVWLMQLDELISMMSGVHSAYLLQAEADAYGCADHLLSSLQGNFTPGQAGVVGAMRQLERIVVEDDVELAEHFVIRHYAQPTRTGAASSAYEPEVALIDFCFRWIHCFLARELPMPLLLRLWDTYLAVGVDAVLPLHVSVCAALVFELRPQLLASRSSDEMMEVLKEPFKHVVKSSRRGDAHEQALQWMQELLARAYQLWRKYPDMASPSNS